jgi:hypothetical protein
LVYGICLGGVTMRLLFILLFVLNSHQLLACDIIFKELNLCAKVKYKVKPNRKKSSDFELSFMDLKSKKTVMPKQQLLTYLWMDMKKDEAHGSDALVVDKKKDHYAVSNVWFLMEGYWQLHIQLREKGKIVAKGYKEYCIAGRKFPCSGEKTKKP